MEKDKINGFECPVCKRFWFDGEECEEEAEPQDKQCHLCGWIYDGEQLKDHSLAGRTNEMSVLEFRRWYKQKREKNKKWEFLLDGVQKEPHWCPVCGKHRFKDKRSYEVCPSCGWEDSGMDEIPDEVCGANRMSFSEYKKEFLSKGKVKKPDWKHFI